MFIGPIQRQSSSERDEKILERIVLIGMNHLVSHVWPWEVIDPCRVRRKQLRGSRGNPVRKPVVILQCGGYLPPHDQEHDVKHGDLFGESS